MRSTPSDLRWRQSSMLCAISQPPSTQSVAEMRTKSGCDSGQIDADGFRYAKQKANAIFEAATIGIGAVIARAAKEIEWRR